MARQRCILCKMNLDGSKARCEGLPSILEPDGRSLVMERNFFPEKPADCPRSDETVEHCFNKETPEAPIRIPNSVPVDRRPWVPTFRERLA